MLSHYRKVGLVHQRCIFGVRPEKRFDVLFVERQANIVTAAMIIIQRVVLFKVSRVSVDDGLQVCV